MNQDSIFAAQSQTAWNEDGPLSISDIKKYNGKYYYYI
jgi:hypothetical protein